MSETTSLKLIFDDNKDAEKAYNILIDYDKKYSNVLSKPIVNELYDNGSGDSYDDYEFLLHAARIISNQGIQYYGEASYSSLSTGNENEEKFKCDGGELVVIDEHSCTDCYATVSSSNGVNIYDGTGELWYCQECGKQYLKDFICEYLEDNDDSLENYSSDTDLDNMSLSELADIAMQIDDCLDVTLPSNTDDENDDENDDDQTDDAPFECLTCGKPLKLSQVYQVLSNDSSGKYWGDYFYCKDCIVDVLIDIIINDNGDQYSEEELRGKTIEELNSILEQSKNNTVTLISSN